MTFRTRVVTSLCAAGLVAAAGAARASWPTWGHDSVHSMRADKPLLPPLGVLWKFTGAPPENAQGSLKGGNKGGVVIDNDTLYFASKNILYAVDADTGELKWQMPEANSEGELSHPLLTSPPALGPGQVYVGDQSGTLTAYNQADGNIDWEMSFKNPVRSAPLLVGQVIFFGCDDDNVYAVDVSAKNVPKPKWKLNVGDDVVAPVTYYGGFLYIVSQDMRVWCVNADTGMVRWVRRVVQPVMNQVPVIAGTQVCVGAGNSVATFRLGNGDGRSITLVDMQADISCPLLVTDTNWYFGDKNGHFWCFDNKAHHVWDVPTDGVILGAPVLCPPGPDGKQLVYAGTNKGFVYAINIGTMPKDKPAEDRIVWRYRVEPPKGMTHTVSYYPIQSPLAVDHDKLYVLSDDGALTCLSPDAIDTEGPVILQPKPSRGGEVNGSPPILFQVTLWDEGSGINPATIHFQIDSDPEVPADAERYDTRRAVKRKGYVYDPVKRTLTYVFESDQEDNQPLQSAVKRLQNGRHTAKVSADDYMGNHSELSWSFTADPSLPRPNVQAAKKRARQLTGGPANSGGYTDSGAGGPGAPAGVGQPGANPYSGQRTGARGGRSGRVIRGPGYNPNGAQGYPGGAYGAPGGYGVPGAPGAPGGAPYGPYGPGVPR